MRYEWKRRVAALLLGVICSPVLAQAVDFDSLELITSENVKQLVELAVLQAEPDPDISWSPDGSLLAVTGWESTNVYLYSEETQFAEPYAVINETASIVEFSPDGVTLAIADTFDTLQFWDLTTETIRTSIAVRDGCEELCQIDDLAFSPDGQLIAVVKRFAPSPVYTVATGDRYMPLDNIFGGYSAEFSQDGRTILVVAQAGEAFLLDVETGEALLSWGRASNRSACVAHFSPDNRLIATGGSEEYWRYTVWLVDSENAEILDTLYGTYGGEFTAWVCTLAFSIDGSILVFPEGKAISVWNTVTSERMLTLPVDDWIFDLAFNPGGTLLTITGQDGTIRLWGIPADASN